MLSRFRLTTFLLVALSLLLAACGGTSTDKSAATPTPAATGSATTAPTPTPDAPRQVKDSTGTVEIKGTPKRIVTLEWTYTENVLALGGTLVGAADIANYKNWVKIRSAIPADVQDVGTREEPSLEKIAALKPDLIVGVKNRHEKILSQLKAIAPTLLFDPYSATAAADQFKDMEDTFLSMGDALNKKAEGQKALSDMNAAIAKGAEKLKAANKANTEVVLTQAYTAQNAAAFRLFTNESLPVKILVKLGLKNGFTASKVEPYGFSTVGVEALTTIQNASLLHTVQMQTDNIFEKFLNANPVWKSLTFVKENRVYALGGDTWPFGGPQSMEAFVDRVVTNLTK